jgi:hypothetical protein
VLRTESTFTSKHLERFELFRIAYRNGKILHAEISIDGSVVMIGDPDDKLYGEPRNLGRTSATLHIFVAQCDRSHPDAVVEKSIGRRHGTTGVHRCSTGTPSVSKRICFAQDVAESAREQDHARL